MSSLHDTPALEPIVCPKGMQRPTTFEPTLSPPYTPASASICDFSNSSVISEPVHRTSAAHRRQRMAEAIQDAVDSAVDSIYEGLEEVPYTFTKANMLLHWQGLFPTTTKLHALWLGPQLKLDTAQNPKSVRHNAIVTENSSVASYNAAKRLESNGGKRVGVPRFSKVVEESIINKLKEDGYQVSFESIAVEKSRQSGKGSVELRVVSISW
ncbi:hypothetical protein BSKO_11738 [Bryopsis sp. KO-2023]|nr:hypothetical protein BSKO_11738 [Bryopsis sp. KO-2023]